MDTHLLKTRLISFGYEFGTLIAAAITGVLLSPEFAQLVQAHFTEGTVASVILLVVTGTVKHIRNKYQLGKAIKLGGGEEHPVTLI